MDRRLFTALYISAVPGILNRRLALLPFRGYLKMDKLQKLINMKKIVIWVNVESSDGCGTLTWFLKEDHAEKHNDTLDQALFDNIYSVETFEGSDIHKQACENSEKYLKKHEYLKIDDYYETRGVGTKARSNKICEYCGKSIPKGIPHDMHHFYPEFQAYSTHKECSTKFINSLN